MDPETLLNQLAPLRQPTTIGWWPPAIGWWLLAALLLLGGAAAGVWQWRRYRNARYRRLALKTLDGCSAAEPLSVAEINRLLKTVALQCWPTEEVANLAGDAWLAFLAASAGKPSGKQDFTELATIYHHPDIPASAQLLAVTRSWIKKHRRAHD